MKYPRCSSRIFIGPAAVDYNSLMVRLEDKGERVLCMTPEYSSFGKLRGYHVYLMEEQK